MVLKVSEAAASITYKWVCHGLKGRVTGTVKDAKDLQHPLKLILLDAELLGELLHPCIDVPGRGLRCSVACCTHCPLLPVRESWLSSGYTVV